MTSGSTPSRWPRSAQRYGDFRDSSFRFSRASDGAPLHRARCRVRWIDPTPYGRKRVTPRAAAPLPFGSQSFGSACVSSGSVPTRTHCRGAGFSATISLGPLSQSDLRMSGSANFGCWHLLGDGGVWNDALTLARCLPGRSHLRHTDVSHEAAVRSERCAHGVQCRDCGLGHRGPAVVAAIAGALSAPIGSPTSKRVSAPRGLPFMASWHAANRFYCS